MTQASYKKITDLQILLFSHHLHIVYIEILICISTLQNNVRNKDNKKIKGLRCAQWPKYLMLRVGHCHVKLAGIDNKRSEK